MGEVLHCDRQQNVSTVANGHGQVAKAKEQSVDDSISVTKMRKKLPSSNCEPLGVEGWKEVKEADKLEVMQRDPKEDGEIGLENKEAHLAEVSSDATLENKEKESSKRDAETTGPVQATEDDNRKKNVAVETHEDHLKPERKNIDPSVSLQAGNGILQCSTQTVADVDKVPHSVEHDQSSTSASGSSSTMKKPSIIFNRHTQEFLYIDSDLTKIPKDARILQIKVYTPESL